MTDPARVAARLLGDRDAIAAAVSSRLYAERPAMLEQYGESGRAKCMQDMRHNIEHLAPAVELERPALFEQYVVWLHELLLAHGVATVDIERGLRLLDAEVRERYGARDGMTISSVINAGLMYLRAPA